METNCVDCDFEHEGLGMNSVSSEVKCLNQSYGSEAVSTHGSNHN